MTALEAAQATGMLTLDRAASILAMHPEDKLLQWEPVGERGPEGQAAWIVEAVRQKFATAFGETLDQLKAIAKGKKKIESTEVIPAEGKDNDIEPKRKAGKDSHGRQQGVYDVAVDDAPILSVIVSLLRGHIRPARSISVA